MLSGHADEIASVPSKLEYTFAPWETGTEMLGSSEFTLYVSSATSTDVDLIARTYDVGPDGSETEVTVGVMRVSGLSPGEVRAVAFKDYGDDWVFAAGHSLRIGIRISTFSLSPPRCE